MKRCKFCDEEIQDIAKKCRFCWEWLEDRKFSHKLNLSELNNSNSFNIEIWKFIFFSTISMWLYQIYFFSKAWYFLEDNKQINWYPRLRALFWIYTLYSMLKKLQILSKNENIQIKLYPITMSIAYFITEIFLIIASNVLNNQNWSVFNSNTFIFALLSSITLIPLVVAYNKLKNI
jgi:hypothetical protein